MRETIVQAGRRQDAGQLTYIRVPENEPLVQLVLHPVHFASDDAEKGLAVDEHLDPILLDLFVKGGWLVDILEMICESAASPIAHANSNQLRLGSFDKVAQVCHGIGRELHCRLARSQLSLALWWGHSLGRLGFLLRNGNGRVGTGCGCR